MSLGSPDRRQMLAWTAGLTIAAGPAAAERRRAFNLGVASGEPTSDGFVIWTRLAPDPSAADGLGGMAGPALVTWEVAEDEAMRRVVRRGRLASDPAWAHAVHVEVEGLKPGRDYFYRFSALGDRSALGRARTAPAPGMMAPSLRLAAASCAHYESGWFSAYRHMAAENPDLVLFLGDYIYEYSHSAQRKVVRRHGSAGELRDLAAYRNRYALHRTDADLQALHAAAPCLATWDDHEVQNDYGGDFSAVGVPPAEFAVRRRAAYQAFYEHMPLRRRARPTSQGVRLFERFGHGQLLQISMLDERQHRSIQPCPQGASRRGHIAPLSCPDLQAADRTMLGKDQREWLVDGFSRSTARWNLIGQQLLVAPYQQALEGGEMGVHTDGWGAYPAERERLLSAVAASGLSNPVFLGGDMHAFLTTDIGHEGRVVATEFVGTSVTSDPPGPTFAQNLRHNPHVRCFEPARRGYLRLDILPDRLEARLQGISDREDPDASLATVKAFVVEPGKAGAVEA